METGDLVRILKELPEARPRILELCPKLIGEDGKINAEKVAFYMKDVTEATEEAESYSRMTQEAVRCLTKLAHLWS